MEQYNYIYEIDDNLISWKDDFNQSKWLDIRVQILYKCLLNI